MIAAQIDSGRYASAGDVVEDALHLLQEQEAWRKNFDEELGRRIERLDRGEFVSQEEAQRRVRATIADAQRRRA